jgi:hypothetical protein
MIEFYLFVYKSISIFIFCYFVHPDQMNGLLFDISSKSFLPDLSKPDMDATAIYKMQILFFSIFKNYYRYKFKY